MIQQMRVADCLIAELIYITFMTHLLKAKSPSTGSGSGSWSEGRCRFESGVWISNSTSNLESQTLEPTTADKQTSSIT